MVSFEVSLMVVSERQAREIVVGAGAAHPDANARHDEDHGEEDQRDHRPPEQWSAGEPAREKVPHLPPPSWVTAPLAGTLSSGGGASLPSDWRYATSATSSESAGTSTPAALRSAVMTPACSRAAAAAAATSASAYGAPRLCL